MAFDPPTPVTVGSVLTASKYNQEVVENVGVIRAAQINVKSTTKTDTFARETDTSTFVDITGFAVTITPSSSSSLILVIASLYTGQAGNNYLRLNLRRGSTNIAQPPSGGLLATTGLTNSGSTDVRIASIVHLDNPGVATAVTYTVQGATNSGGNNWYINRRGDNNTVGTSSITVMEIAV